MEKISSMSASTDVTDEAQLERKYVECLIAYESRRDSDEDTLEVFRSRFLALKERAQVLEIKYLDMVDRVSARRRLERGK